MGEKQTKPFQLSFNGLLKVDFQGSHVTSDAWPQPCSQDVSPIKWDNVILYGPTAAALLDDSRIGVIHLDRRGRILEVNDRARRILRRGGRLSDNNGVLSAREPDDQCRLARLVADALPTSGAVPVSGSMLLGRSSRLPPFVVHVQPVGAHQPDYGARHAAALVLIAEPGRRHRIDPDLVAKTLGLTPAESRVAVALAEGKSVRAIAEAAGHTKDAIYWHLKHIYKKQSISRQADLVRLVLSIAEFG